jgi:hypothetical protein
MENRCIKIRGLNKYKKKILHNEADRLKLFHWSEQIDDQNSDLFVSNRKEHESIYKIYQKRYFRKNKTTEDRLKEIDGGLTNLSVRGHKALQIKKKTFTSIQTSSETTFYIDNLLNEKYNVTDDNEAKKPRKTTKNCY